MLKKQQTNATIAARNKIVEQAVTMVNMAIKQLAESNITFNHDEKTKMVVQLMSVLCADTVQTTYNTNNS